MTALPEGVELEQLVKAEAFGEAPEGMAAALREPDNLDTWRIAVLRIANDTTAQLIERGNTDRDWYRRATSLRNRLQNRLSEIKVLVASRNRTQNHQVAELRHAIRAHQRAVLAVKAEPEPFDLTLWAALEEAS